MKESQLLREKTTSSVFVQHVQTLCMPSFIDLHTHATAGHVTSFACTKLQSKHFRLIAGMIAPHDREDLRDRGET